MSYFVQYVDYETIKLQCTHHCRYFKQRTVSHTHKKTKLPTASVQTKRLVKGAGDVSKSFKLIG